LSKYDLNKVGTEDFQARIDEVIDRKIAEKKKLIGTVDQVSHNETQCYSRTAERLGMNNTGLIAFDDQRLSVAYANDLPEPFRLLDFDHVSFIEDSSGFRLDPGEEIDDMAYQSGGIGMIGSAHLASNTRRWRNGKAAPQPLWCRPITKSNSGGNSQ